jgi:hypothetical protein
MELRNIQEETSTDLHASPEILGTIPAPTERAELTTDAALESDIGAETSKELARQRRNMTWMFGTLSIPLILALLYRFSIISLPIEPENVIWLFGCLLAGPGAMAIFMLRDLFRLQSLSQKAAELDDIEQIGTLIDLLSVENKSIRVSAVQALVRLLPQIRPEHSELLTSSQRTRLIRILDTDPETLLYKDLGAFLDVGGLLKSADRETEAYRRATDVRVAILQAYAHIGGAQELATVQRLANLKSSSPTRKRLSSAAKEVLLEVKQRAESERNYGTLLRPIGPKSFGTQEVYKSKENPSVTLRSGSSHTDETAL